MKLLQSVLLSIVLLYSGGCAGYPFDNADHEALILMYSRQHAIEEQVRHQAEISEAVKNFQIQAIKGGFAYWDVVDYSGRVEFKWVGQTRK
jgi:phosphoribosylformylglycinamidine (FGAM) synthase-like amidotransferase family enzyme